LYSVSTIIKRLKRWIYNEEKYIWQGCRTEKKSNMPTREFLRKCSEQKQGIYRVSISPHSSPENDPSSFCNPAISVHHKQRSLDCCKPLYVIWLQNEH
jgi:hypothetical protein